MSRTSSCTGVVMGASLSSFQEPTHSQTQGYCNKATKSNTNNLVERKVRAGCIVHVCVLTRATRGSSTWEIRKKNSKRMISYDLLETKSMIIAELRLPEGPPSGAPKASHTWETKGNPWVDFLMVIMASGVARGRVRTTAATVESRNMAAILPIMGWQRYVALVYCVLL